MPEATPFLTDTGILSRAGNASIDPLKLVVYSLNLDHASDGHKVFFFDRVLGYNRANADDLAAVILKGILTTPARPGAVDEDHARFNVDLVVRGQSGRVATIRTGWIYRPGESFSRLTTALVRRGGTDANATAP